MNAFIKESLKHMLKQHKIWLDSNFTKGKQANLSYTDLRNSNLCKVNLSYADLSHADLSNVDLHDTILIQANLNNSILKDGELRNVNLSNSSLKNADLSNTDLSNADLSHVNLSHANLSNADLRYTNLSNANLSCVDLTLTDLHEANLKDAKFDYATLPLRFGSLYANFDEKQVAQFLYYVLSMVQNSYNVSETIQQTLLTELNVNFANQFNNADFYNGDKLIAYKNTEKGRVQQ